MAAIPVDEALAIVLAHTPTLAADDVLLTDAVGRVLAEAIAADQDMPPFDRSAMDGYAVRAADVAHAPVTLNVVGQIRAGQYSTQALQPGQAVQVMTDHPISACMASQYAGWKLAQGKFFAMGSGPMRAAAAKEKPNT